MRQCPVYGSPSACRVDQLLDTETLHHLATQEDRVHVHSWRLPDPELVALLGDSFDLDNLVLGMRGDWGDIRVACPQQGGADWIARKTPTPELIRRLYRNGYSVVVNDLQDKLYCAFTLCQELGALLVSGVNCNAYLTSAATPGLVKHYDDEDVIVVQLRGSKTWHLYPPRCALDPLPGLDYCQAHVDDCEKIVTEVMTPGKALYIPRGVPHEAFCTDESSLHFTFSIQGASQADLIRELLDATVFHVEDPYRFRRRIPLDWLRDGQVPPAGLQSIRAALMSMAAALNEEALGKAMAAVVRGRCQGMASPLLAGCSEMESDLHDASGLRRRSTQALVHAPTVGKALFKGGSFDLDDEGTDFLRRVAHDACIPVRDLPRETAEARRLLACQLIDNGLMERA